MRHRGGRGVQWCTAGSHRRRRRRRCCCRRRLCKYFLILFVAHKRSKANVQAAWSGLAWPGRGMDRGRGRGRGRAVDGDGAEHIVLTH